MNPVLWVVRSLILAVNPPDGSVMDTCSTSPEFIFSVLLLPRKVPVLGSCGAGGPGGTPLVCRKEKFTGSTQLLLQEPLLLHARLSMLSAEHHWAALQLVESMNGVKPGA